MPVKFLPVIGTPGFTSWSPARIPLMRRCLVTLLPLTPKKKLKFSLTPGSKSPETCKTSRKPWFPLTSKRAQFNSPQPLIHYYTDIIRWYHVQSLLRMQKEAWSSTISCRKGFDGAISQGKRGVDWRCQPPKMVVLESVQTAQHPHMHKHAVCLLGGNETLSKTWKVILQF